MTNSDFLTHLPLHNQLLIAVTNGSETKEVQASLDKVLNAEKWHKTVQMAYTHALIPQLFKALKKQVQILPESKLTTLSTLTKQITFDNIKLSAELIKITTLLETHDLPYISIKGPALSQELYSDITIRQICDLDILVKKENLITIAKHLLTLGYIHQLPLSLLQNSGFLALDNDFTFLHREKMIVVELHWKLFPTRHKMPLDFERLYQKTKQINIQKKSINVLSTEHNLVYLCLHASKHIFEQLKWVCDINVLVRNNTNLNFDKLIIMAKEIDVLEPFLLGLLMSQQLYKTPLPKSITQEATPTTHKLLQQALSYFAEDFTSLEEPTKKRIRFLFLQKLNNNKQNRFVSLFMAAFRPSSVDYIYYQLPEKLNFLYPLLRPLRLLYKYGLKRFKL